MEGISQIGNELHFLLSGPAIEGLKGQLHPGDLVRAKILEVLGQGKFIVRFRGQNVVAESASAMPQGAVILASVSAVEPRIILRILSPRDRQRAIVDALRGMKLSVSKLHVSILYALYASDIQANRSDVLALAQWASRLFHQAGQWLVHEEVIQLLVWLHSKGLPATSENLQRAFTKLWRRKIDIGTADALSDAFSAASPDSAPDEADYIYFRIPMDPRSGAEVELRIYYEDQGKKRRIDKDNTRLVFSFEGLSLGPLELEVAIQQSRLKGTFSVLGEAQRDFIAGEIPELVERLRALGYVLLDMDCRVVEHIPEEAFEEEPFEYNGLTDTAIDWVV